MKKKDILERLCPECMAVAIKNGVCSVCGYNDGNEPTYIYKQALHPRTVLNGRYVIGKVIEYRKFSTLYYAFDLDEQKRIIVECVADMYNRVPFYTSAVKSIDKIIKDVHARMNKVYGLNENGIIAYNDFIECEGSFYFISDMYSGMPLSNVIDARKGLFRTGEVLNIMKALRRPVEAMNAIKIPNGCLNTDRIIMSGDGSVRIKDSSHMAVLFAQQKEEMAESPYTPCDFYSDDIKLTESSDVYSLAAICYKMLSGKDIPLATEREYEDDIQNPNDFGANLTEEGVQVLRDALSVYPDDRIKTVREFIERFEEANEAVLEIENDLTSDFDFDIYEKTQILDDNAAPASPEEVISKSIEVAEPKSSGGKKKAYHGIAMPVKVIVIGLFAAILVLELLMFVGVIDPITVLAKRGVEVPDVSGLTLEQAKKKLSDSGLNILVVDAYKCKNLSNTVYKQTPYANKRTARGDVVAITASTGNEEYEKGKVPNVRYMKLDSAFDILSNKCGFNVVISLTGSNDVMSGCVVAQSEFSGIELPEGSTIKLTVSSGSLLQSERIKVSEHMKSESSAVVFMDGDLVYAVRVAEAGSALGELMPGHPSEKLHNNLDFIGWSRAPGGTGGEFTDESHMSGVMMVYAFFADRGTTIATPTPEPSIVIEEIDPEETMLFTENPIWSDFPIQSEYIMTQAPLTSIPVVSAPAATPTPVATPKPTPTPTPTEDLTEEPTAVPTPTQESTPKPTQTPKPTDTPEPEPSYYINDIFFTESEITIHIGETKKLKVMFDGNPKTKELKFRSSKKDIATISSTGEVTGVSVGTTYVYAVSYENGVHEASCKVTVID